MPSNKTTTKALYYLRAIRSSRPFDLQLIIEEARLVANTCASSAIKLGDGDFVQIQRFRKQSGHALLHLARYVPGVTASTLHPRAATVEDNEGNQSPPNGEEFKDGDCFLLVSRHHVLYCGHGISKSKAHLYLSKLFEKTGLKSKSSHFELVPAGNSKKIELIQNHGVKSIQLGVGSFDLSLPRKKSFFEGFFALISKEQSLSEQRDLEDIMVNVEVKLDGNTRAITGSQNYIRTLAERILCEDESAVNRFCIVTQQNEKITPSEIRIQTNVRVITQDNSINPNSVWEKMSIYFEEIRSSNLLEQ